MLSRTHHDIWALYPVSRLETCLHLYLCLDPGPGPFLCLCLYFGLYLSTRCFRRGDGYCDFALVGVQAARTRKEVRPSEDLEKTFQQRP